MLLESILFGFVLMLIAGSSLTKIVLPSIQKSIIYGSMSLIWALSFIYGVVMVLSLDEERELKNSKLLIYKVFKVFGIINLFVLSILVVSILLFSIQNLLVILAVMVSPFVFLGLIFISEIILILNIKKHLKDKAESKYSHDFKQKLISISIAAVVIFSLLGYFNYNTICTRPAWFSCSAIEFNPGETRGQNLVEDQKWVYKHKIFDDGYRSNSYSYLDKNYLPTNQVAQKNGVRLTIKSVVLNRQDLLDQKAKDIEKDKQKQYGYENAKYFDSQHNELSPVSFEFELENNSDKNLVFHKSDSGLTTITMENYHTYSPTSFGDGLFYTSNRIVSGDKLRLTQNYWILPELKSFILHQKVDTDLSFKFKIDDIYNVNVPKVENNEPKFNTFKNIQLLKISESQRNDLFDYKVAKVEKDKYQISVKNISGSPLNLNLSQDVELTDKAGNRTISKLEKISNTNSTTSSIFMQTNQTIESVFAVPDENKAYRAYFSFSKDTDFIIIEL